MELTFAQALNEAKQVIVQQAARIRADADKIKVQQEMLMSQGSTLSEHERRIREQAADIERLNAEVDTLTHKLGEALTGKEQAEAIINRQGERITNLQAMSVDMEKRLGEQSERIHDLEREREGLVERLPTQEDADALASMSALLTKKVTSAAPRQGVQMRLADAA